MKKKIDKTPESLLPQRTLRKQEKQAFAVWKALHNELCRRTWVKENR
jgi:hypothetical protein